MTMQAMLDPFFNPGWIEFNERQWGLRSETLELGPEKGSAWCLRTVIYRRKDGRLVTPPRTPHLPFDFECSRDRSYGRNRCIRTAVEKLAERYEAYGLHGSINLSPLIQDIRPFLWRGMSVYPRHTYHLVLDDFKEHMDREILRKVSKAQRSGYTCEITDDFTGVQECLKEPEERKGFSHKVDEHGLKMLADLLGQDGVQPILCRDAVGRPAGAWLQISNPGGMVYNWSAGVKTDALKDGVNSFIAMYCLNFFADKKYRIFDFCGASIPSVSAMKESWGGVLVPYFQVKQHNFRALAVQAFNTLNHYVGIRHSG